MALLSIYGGMGLHMYIAQVGLKRGLWVVSYGVMLKDEKHVKVSFTYCKIWMMIMHVNFTYDFFMN